ncbi:MAG: hypothetical protein IJZ93_00205 [Clostridia bacterium]|nr:hypothetical protein [Clostridia bacterium]
MNNFFGFASLYIAFSGMISLKKKNLPITVSILGVFSVLAYVVNILLAEPDSDGVMKPHNYMFLMRDDGTPYSIFYNLVNGNSVLYPLLVVGAFVAYVVLFYFIYNTIKEKQSLRLRNEYKKEQINLLLFTCFIGGNVIQLRKRLRAYLKYKAEEDR